MTHPWPHQALGNPRRPPVVFLHGFLGRGDDWLPVARALAGDFYCLLPDLPGHGAHTTADPSEPLTFETLSTGLAETLRALGLHHPVLVGYSLGGRAALHLACTHPGLASALVLESASPGLIDSEARAARAALDDARADRLRTQGLAAFFAEWYRAPLWNSLQQRPDLMAETVTARSRNDARWMAKTLSELSPGRMPPLWDCLPRLELPLLVMAGLLDEKYTRLAPQVAGLVPGARFKGIPDAGHNIHLEQPAAFIEALAGILEDGGLRPRGE